MKANNSMNYRALTVIGILAAFVWCMASILQLLAYAQVSAYDGKLVVSVRLPLSGSKNMQSRMALQNSRR